MICNDIYRVHFLMTKQKRFSAFSLSFMTRTFVIGGIDAAVFKPCWSFEKTPRLKLEGRNIFTGGACVPHICQFLLISDFFLSKRKLLPERRFFF